MRKTIFIILGLLCYCLPALALPPGQFVSPGTHLAKPSHAMIQDTRTMINVNNLQMFCTNIGSFAEDIAVMLETAKADGLYFPAGTDRSVIYSGGVWIGGTVYNAAADTVGGQPNEIRLAIGAYDSPEYFPGPAVSTDAPFSVFSADFDLDGFNDLAYVDYYSSQISIMINTGDESVPFSSTVDYSAGDSTIFVYGADFGGDSALDLAVANYYSDNVSILINNGDGTFASAVDYTVGTGPYSIFAGDFDGDNDVDLATANIESNDVSILLNNGDGTFATAVAYDVGTSPTSITGGDFDGDSDIDLAAANNTDDSVSVLLNAGDGTFAAAVNYETGDGPFAVLAAYVDAGTDLDLVVTNINDDSVSILIGNGDGTFAAPVNYATGGQPMSVFAADFDDDTFNDLAVADNSSDSVSILINNGDGTFASAVNYRVGGKPMSVFAADFDGDTTLDLAVANSNYEDISVLLNNGDGTFTRGMKFGPGGGLQSDLPAYKIYKIWGDSTVWENPVKTGIELADGTPYTRFDSAQHFNDYLIWPDDQGAPLDSTGAPMLIGDQMLWGVFNDGGTHTYDGYGGATDSLGVEVQATYFGYDLPGALGNTIFMKFIFINKSPNVIDSCYVSLWADPDLGGASDDLVGCDTTLSLGFCYNATNNDNTYGSSPPAVGYDFMQGPIIRYGDPLYADTSKYHWDQLTATLNDGTVIDSAFILGLTSFDKYINGTDPDEPVEAYGYMRGNDSKAGSGGDVNTPPLDNNNVRTKFYYAGDPVKGTGWNDSKPADRRYMCNTGPFTFNPNDTQIVVGAIVVGQGKDRLSSVTGLKFYDNLAQFAYNRNFDIPAPPPRPVVTARAYDGKVALTWGNRSETDYNEPTHRFEGYIVYQGETIVGDDKGKWTPIAYFDKKNGYGLLSDFVLDPDLGAVVFVPTVYGTDTDLGYGIEITDDGILGGKLHNGRTYYFAVTAYSYDFDDFDLYQADPARADSEYAIPKGLWYLENRIQAIPVTPMNPLAGDDWDYSDAHTPDVATLSLVDSLLAPATDVVEVHVIDPDSITGHNYQVRFVPVYPDTVNGTPVYPDSVTPDGEFVLVQNGFDTVNVASFWELWDVTNNERLLDRQYNKSGNNDYRVMNGLLVKVIGAYRPSLQSVNYINVGAPQALFGVEAFGMNYFGGGVDVGDDGWGGYLNHTTMPDSFTTVELRFTGDKSIGQRAYGYCRSCVPNYGYEGYFQVPFIAWDVTRNMQVNVAFVEDANGLTYDSTFSPSTLDDNYGNREYLFILHSAYDGDDPADAGTGAIDYPNEDISDGSTFDIMYFGAFYMNPAFSAGGVIDSGDVLQFLQANKADSNDIYSFSTTKPLRHNASIGAEALDKIRVVPNPYYAYSIYEKDQFDRQVRFLGLPDKFTMRIFNLAGDMVRTMNENDKVTGQSWMPWNLMTDEGLPVASGVYIWYLESDFGTKYGKMAIIQEVEQLNTY